MFVGFSNKVCAVRSVLNCILAAICFSAMFVVQEAKPASASDRAVSTFWQQAAKKRPAAEGSKVRLRQAVSPQSISVRQRNKRSVRAIQQQTSRISRRNRQLTHRVALRQKRENAQKEFFDYKPEKRINLRDRKLRGEVSDNSYSSWILHTLRYGAKPRLRTDVRSRDAIFAIYKEIGFAPIWIYNQGLTEKGRRLLETLAGAPKHALTVERYLPPVLTSFGSVPNSLLDDPRKAAALEVGLTMMALRYARHASGGQVEPEKIGKSYDITPPVVGRAEALRSLATTDQPDDYLEGLHPRHPLYLKLKLELNGANDNARQKPVRPIPAGRLLQKGSVNARVLLIRARLAKLGFLPQDQGPSEDYFDEKLDRAIKKFQATHGLARDGLVGRRTLRALNDGRSRARKRRRSGDFKRKLVLNMERLRWLPRDLGDRHIIVNQAAYQAQVIEEGRKIHQMKVIIGKPRHPTPLFSDEMETVVFNPYWYIPRSILKTSHLPRARRSPGYLDRRGFEVLNWKGERVRSRRVKWHKYNSENLPYVVRQKPGRKNALGRIKFLFPNKHAVYMHDTPSRHLFRSQRRAYSHGCVRVQDPARFAEVVLGWHSSKVKAAVDARKNLPIRLTSKIPVHMTYFTLWPDEDGNLVAHQDIYGRDEALRKALRVVRTRKNRQRKRKRSKRFKVSSLE